MEVSPSRRSSALPYEPVFGTLDFDLADIDSVTILANEEVQSVAKDDKVAISRGVHLFNGQQSQKGGTFTLVIMSPFPILIV